MHAATAHRRVAASSADRLAVLADSGDAVAQYLLGTRYLENDPRAALRWLAAAAAQGNRKAMHNLAMSFADGATGKKGMAEAARWFAQAAALGLPDSQFNLAVLYETGAGVPQSLADAYKWYAIAAASGDGESKARHDLLQARLSDADKAAANKAAASFHAAPLNRAANVPPEPADLGM
jgi:localization factor PodJL